MPVQGADGVYAEVASSLYVGTTDSVDARHSGRTRSMNVSSVTWKTPPPSRASPAVMVEPRPAVVQRARLQTPGREQSDRLDDRFGGVMSADDHLEVALASDSGAPREARDHVQAFLDAHGLKGEAGQAALVIASELVTNAVVHASAPIRLEVAVRDRTLQLAVHDGDAGAALVATRRVDWGDSSGRGVEIVASLARCWGVQTDADGKQVWAQIDVPTRERADPR